MPIFTFRLHLTYKYRRFCDAVDWWNTFRYRMDWMEVNHSNEKCLWCSQNVCQYLRGFNHCSTEKWSIFFSLFVLSLLGHMCRSCHFTVLVKFKHQFSATEKLTENEKYSKIMRCDEQIEWNVMVFILSTKWIMSWDETRRGKTWKKVGLSE